ncbi:MAG: hypothetical protein KJ626_03500 [Verrucomicrobia bacterium]|nr:hypothetical protein [Verrucomicrobiota bacterium]
MPDSEAQLKSMERGRSAAWKAWKELCALNLCAADFQGMLGEFARVRAQRYIQAYAHRTNASAQAISLNGRDAWHLFETYHAVRDTREGKRYKEWIFASIERAADGEADALEGRAALLMRDVIREFLRREFSPPQAISMRSTVPGADGSSQSVEDLLPGTANPEEEVALREYEQLARRHAEEFVFTLKPREKIAILAKELGLPLSHPTVQTLAGRRKSALSDTYRQTFTRLAKSLSSSYPQEDRSAVRHIILRTFSHVGVLVSQWGHKDDSCFELIDLAGAS